MLLPYRKSTRLLMMLCDELLTPCYSHYKRPMVQVRVRVPSPEQQQQGLLAARAGGARGEGNKFHLHYRR